MGCNKLCTCVRNIPQKKYLIKHGGKVNEIMTPPQLLPTFDNSFL